VAAGAREGGASERGWGIEFGCADPMIIDDCTNIKYWKVEYIGFPAATGGTAHVPLYSVVSCITDARTAAAGGFGDRRWQRRRAIPDRQCLALSWNLHLYC
jgi:hypothetical protein